MSPLIEVSDLRFLIFLVLFSHYKSPRLLIMLLIIIFIIICLIIILLQALQQHLYLFRDHTSVSSVFRAT